MKYTNPHLSDEELLNECSRVLKAIRAACQEERDEWVGGWTPDERRLDIRSHAVDPLYGDAVGVLIQLDRRLKPAHKSGAKNLLTAGPATDKIQIHEGEDSHGA